MLGGVVKRIPSGIFTAISAIQLRSIRYIGHTVKVAAFDTSAIVDVHLIWTFVNALELIACGQVHIARVLAHLRAINIFVVPGRAATCAGLVRLNILALLARGDAESSLVVLAGGALGPARVRVVVVLARLRALPRLRVPEHRDVALSDHVFAIYNFEILVVAQIVLTVSVCVPVRSVRTLGSALLNTALIHVYV